MTDVFCKHDQKWFWITQRSKNADRKITCNDERKNVSYNSDCEDLTSEAKTLYQWGLHIFGSSASTTDDEKQ